MHQLPIESGENPAASQLEWKMRDLSKTFELPDSERIGKRIASLAFL